MKNTTIIPILILVILAGTGLFIYSSYVASGGIPPMTPPVTDPTTGETYSFSMFQAARVVYYSGDDSWKFPKSRTSLTSLIIIDPLDTERTVTTMQSYIYFNFMSSKQVSSVTFTANAKLSLYSSSKSWIVDFGDMPVSQIIANPVNNTDNYVISATQSADDFEAMYDYPNTPGQAWSASYYYVIVCRNIQAVITYSDGTTRTASATDVQATENQLWWQFRVLEAPGYQIVNPSVEWMWK